MHSPGVGCLSYITSRAIATGNVTSTNIEYAGDDHTYPVLPSVPSPFASPNDLSASVGYEFFYAPNLITSIESSSATDGAYFTQLERLFNTYQYFKVTKMYVNFERVGRKPLLVQDVGVGATAVTANARSGGADGFFMCCRRGNPYFSVRPSDNSANWSIDEELVMSAYGQMKADYPRMKRCMRYVRDLTRTKRIRFAFTPTVTSPVIQTGFSGLNLVNASNAPSFRPLSGQPLDLQPQYFKRMPWTPTSWRTSSGGTGARAFDYTIYGVSGALRPGSWLPGDWAPWQMTVKLKLMFKKRVPPRGSTGAELLNTRPMNANMSAFLNNSSYNINL